VEGPGGEGRDDTGREGVIGGYGECCIAMALWVVAGAGVNSTVNGK
jgi:hypothetical protein